MYLIQDYTINLLVVWVEESTHAWSFEDYESFVSFFLPPLALPTLPKAMIYMRLMG